MRAMVVRKHGPPEVLELGQFPDPQPKSGEVVVRVRAVGVNFGDLLQRMGLYPGAPKPPFIPGLEVAGVVEKTAETARSPAARQPLEPGEAVAALTRFNAYAEWVTVPSEFAYRLPQGMTFEDAAAIPVNYLAAYHAMFFMGNLQPGDRLLIHGAAGGVGHAAIQLARARGLLVFGTAGPSKQDYLRKIGVDHPIDHEKSDFVEVVRKFAPEGIEMVMDPIGGRSFSKSYQCLGPTGRLVVYGFSAAAGKGGKRNLWDGLVALMQTPRFHPLKLMENNISVTGVSLTGLQARPAILQNEMDELFRLYSAGKIKPLVGKTFPLARAVEAHRFLHDRKNIGKVVLTIK
jgi:NADPH:quinone reductase-like Zn-dependent oxidoreductase